MKFLRKIQFQKNKINKKYGKEGEDKELCLTLWKVCPGRIECNTSCMSFEVSMKIPFVKLRGLNAVNITFFI